MKVWLLISEEDAVAQDRYVIGVFETPAAAVRARDVAEEEARSEGKVVYGDTDEDDEEIADWDIDFDVEEHEVEA
jgi:hypothetical protein